MRRFYERVGNLVNEFSLTEVSQLVDQTLSLKSA